MIRPTVEGPELARRVQEVRRRIEAAGGHPERVTLVAVTKGFDPTAVALARDAGLVDLGESYAQELRQKAAEGDGLRWHWIGRLQRNKVRQVAAHVHLWHSVDRVEVGVEIARRAPGASVLAQVNTSGEDSKGGCPPEATEALVADLRKEGLEVRGLMTVAAVGDRARDCFADLRRLADDLDLPERSMGMSEDLEAAVAEGSTMVRLGSALFGPRTPPVTG